MTSYCVFGFENVTYIIMHVILRRPFLYTSSRPFQNTEVNTSDFQENLKDMSHGYIYLHNYRDAKIVLISPSLYT